MNNVFIINKSVSSKCDPRMINLTLRRMWSSFLLGGSEITMTDGDKLTFVIGEAAVPMLADGDEFAAVVCETGAAVVGRDVNCLIRGYISLLLRIENDKNGGYIRCGSWTSGYRIDRRMIHICVFPETDLYFIRKMIRLAGICQYTHIVIEFWGALKYDCLKELAWPEAYTKEQIEPIITEARELGMEPIPMSNQLGHATASRVAYGKHVVLDQNPSLEYLFTPDGWAWNIRSEDTYLLLRDIRAELSELFGAGEFFHIGCDEAYYISRSPELRAALPEYLGRLTRDVEKEGRAPMLWMDMFIEAGKYKDCYGSAQAGESEKLISSLAESSVCVDWQYGAKQVPVESLDSLVGCGRRVIGAPWLDRANYRVVADTVIKNNQYGVMLTTWHTLREQIAGVWGCADHLGASGFAWKDMSGLSEITAALMRRVSLEGNDYRTSGWAERQISV